MAQPVRIEPDVSFIRELQEAGGESVKKCYQCATCSVACPISPSASPFPRKEMIWAQWGLKDKLLNNPDIWLCHNCGGCSDLCPRGANPGDVIGALRNITYKKLVGPKIMGEMMSSAKYLPVLFAIPAVLFALVWYIMATVVHTQFFPNGGMFPIPKPGVGIEFGRVFYGDYTIDIIFMLVMFFVLYIFYKGIVNLIAGLRPEGTTLVVGKQKHWITCLIEVVCLEILPHSKFASCGDEEEKKARKVGHMALVFGFISLAIVTGCVSVAHWVGRIPLFSWMYFDTPMPLTHPLKILAIVGTLLLLVGMTWLTVRRINLNKSKHTSNYYDWYLLGVIWAVTLTGAASMLFRLAQWTAPAFIIYYLHLVSVFMLFTYLPWTKLGHLVYRTAALTYVRYMGRR